MRLQVIFIDAIKKKSNCLLRNNVSCSWGTLCHSYSSTPVAQSYRNKMAKTSTNNNRSKRYAAFKSTFINSNQKVQLAWELVPINDSSSDESDTDKNNGMQTLIHLTPLLETQHDNVNDQSAATVRAQDCSGISDLEQRTDINNNISSLGTNVSTSAATSSSKSNENDRSIPESVLQFQRQKRKAQHAKKVSKVLQMSSRDAIPIVYIDDDIIVVNKPSGVLTVPGINDRSCVLTWIHEQFSNDAVEIPQHRLVHRLDMDTSGLVVFGRNRSTTLSLHELFRNRQVDKAYVALVQGHWPTSVNNNNGNGDNDQTITQTKDDGCKSNTCFDCNDHGLIDLPLQRDHRFPPFMRVATPQSQIEAIMAAADLQSHGYKKIVAKNAQPSQTKFRVLERSYFGNNQKLYNDSLLGDNVQNEKLPYTRLWLEPVTGRTHQLRAHCAALGFPIVGDPTYSLYGEAAPQGGLDDIPRNERCVNTGASLEIQKAWTSVYPPNKRLMCLHATKLSFVHPVTNEMMMWEVPPAF